MEDAGEIRSLELEVAGVVEVAETPFLAVDELGHDPRLHMVDPIADARGVGEVEGVDLHGDEVALDVVDDRPPDVDLEDLHPEQVPEILGRELEQCPLGAVEVGAQGEGTGGQGLVAERVEDLDHHVEPAVRLGPVTVGGVQLVRVVRGGVEVEDSVHHGHSTPRTEVGQVFGSNPCRRNKARVVRSTPTAKHAEWATVPAAHSMPKLCPKWSWCRLTDVMAVGASSEVTVVTNSSFSASSR